MFLRRLPSRQRATGSVPHSSRFAATDSIAGPKNVVVAYTAGYSTTPPEVAQACIELIALRYRERTRIGEVSRSLGGAETVAYAQKDMSDAVKTLLQQYRLVAPIAPIQQAPAVSATDATIISGVL
jgi:hypothetical protein